MASPTGSVSPSGSRMSTLLYAKNRKDPKDPYIEDSTRISVRAVTERTEAMVHAYFGVEDPYDKGLVNHIVFGRYLRVDLRKKDSDTVVSVIHDSSLPPHDTKEYKVLPLADRITAIHRSMSEEGAVCDEVFRIAFAQVEGQEATNPTLVAFFNSLSFARLEIFDKDGSSLAYIKE